MKWKKAPDELVARFEEVVPGPPAEARKMFGYPAAFLKGNMFMGLHEDRFILRLPEPDRETLMRAGGTQFEPMAGRPMREYVVVPQSILSITSKLEKWIDKSLDYAKTLPAKSKLKAKAKPKSKSKSKAKPRNPPTRRRSL